MTVEQLLTELRSRHVYMRAEGAELRLRASKGAITPELRAALTEHKPALIALLRRTGSVTGRIEQTRRDKPLPLSFAQQRLWFIDQLESKSPIYNMPVALRVEGPLQIAVVERALSEIVRRHESLRTFFPLVDGSPVQEIAAAGPVQVPVIDVQAADVEERVNDEARQPFDLATGPLLRASVLRIGPEDHVVLLTMHHIVSDAWSMRVFTREMTMLYAEYLRGATSPLPELSIQYADYAVWQRQSLTGEPLESKLAYWTQQLDGTPPLLSLPADRPRPAVQSYRGASESFDIPADTTGRMRKLGRESEATLFMTLLTAFAAMLSRWTGQDDVVIGSPVANRSRPEIEPLIGFFANTLPLRVDCSGDPTFCELLARVRRVALDAYAHQDLPFERLVEALRPERTLSYTPLFQTTFQVQDAPMGNLHVPGLELQPLEPKAVNSKFDFSWILEETGDRLIGRIDYSTDLFDVATIRRMIGHFRTFLDGILADPDRSLFRLPILEHQEREQILVSWNQTSTDFPRDRTIADLFEEQAAATPDAVALIWREERWTYRELNRRANRLAHHLQSIGVGPETLVGISVPRSVDAIVATLGVVKAGGAYVPLDPSYPRPRLDLVIRDARLSIVLTPETLVEAPESLSPENPKRATTAENLAYVIYTSGSTGVPKGTCIAHRSVIRLVRNTNFAKMDADEVFLQVAPLAFDASTFEVWGSLLNGGTLVVFPEENITLEGLSAALHRYGVTIIFLTGSLFHQMMERLPEGLSGLRQLLAGGEAVSPSHVNAALAKLPNTRLINGYGPTESTTFAVCGMFTEPIDAGRPAPLGRPIANTRAYILDRHLQPVPVGVTGELHLGGEGLARCYLNNPELTAERFITDPFSDDPSDRLYKTGDLTRYLPDGRIEYLGRDDRQVKIRGFRIELGDVEAALQQHPAVRKALVTIHKDVLGDKKLVAYVVPLESPLSETDLRSFLHARVPAYIVPSAFVTLAEVPLNPHGKVNWSALPAPNEHRPDLRTAYAMPRTDAERIVADVWRELLQIDEVGLHDNFFDLGGHSLLLAHSLSKLRETFGEEVKLSLVDLFRFPTVHTLAEQLSRSSAPQQNVMMTVSRADRRSARADSRNTRSQVRKQFRELPAGRADE
ncbi:MAG: amino acid adenylation domain-containing protein [Acidobacteriota bacterium]|nr:amino acid adenylation domain-containing protein [Acidobacteriota bacterium]